MTFELSWNGTMRETRFQYEGNAIGSKTGGEATWAGTGLM